MLEIAGEDPEVLSSPPPSLQFTDLGDNSLNFQLNCYTANVYSGAGISFRIREKIVERFRENNINIPYPQRVILHIFRAGNPALIFCAIIALSVCAAIKTEYTCLIILRRKK